MGVVRRRLEIQLTGRRRDRVCVTVEDTMSSEAITTRELRKTFGSTVALKALNLSVVPGEVHGFLGPNGAGKTTTLRILLGLLRADAGRVRVLGADPWRDAERLHRRLAYVPGDVSLWPNLTGGEVIDLLLRLRGVRGTTRREELIERFELDPTKRCRSYSKGNRQKVALVAALATDVDLLLLDEPTAGLDPLIIDVFRSVIDEVRKAGGSVLLSSHLLSEVEVLADRVTIIRDGRTVDSGAISELRHAGRTSVSAVLSTPPPVGFGPDNELSGFQLDGHRVAFTVDTTRVADIVGRLDVYGVRNLTCQPPTLEQLFLDEYRSAGQSSTEVTRR